MQDTKVEIITAFELRQIGIDIPKSIPDHFYVNKSSVKAVPMHLDDSNNGKHAGLSVKYQTIISETFRK